MGQQFYLAILHVTGDEASLSAFESKHLLGGTFSLNTIMPMPPELSFDMNNFVEDGYEAQFGDWTKLQSRWMFKEHASLKGYPFPLESREQVLECLNSLGEHGQKRLELGQLYNSNKARYGHGHSSEWRTEHWGSFDDVINPSFKKERTGIVICFTTCGAPPRKALRLLSSQHPVLSFILEYTDDFGRASRAVSFQSGKMKPQPAPEPHKISEAHASLSQAARA